MAMLNIDKIIEKALANINVSDLQERLVEGVYTRLNEAGHSIRSVHDSSGTGYWTAECLNCDFTAQGNSGGTKAVNAMAAVHLGEVSE